MSSRRSADTSGADFLAGGGEMGERMRGKDWAATPLGPPLAWPQSLKTAVRIMLTSRQPMFVWWGDELINLYNDAYRAIVGGKHPEALGQPASVVWREIWDQVEPRASSALHGNEGTYDESLLLIMERNGYPEETYYTFSYSPVPDDHGRATGIICANTDDTQRLIGERQLALLRELAAGTVDARTFDEACASSARCLATNPHDLPFALLYRIEPESGRAVLAGSCGIEPGHPAAPQSIALGDDSLWPFAAVMETLEVTPITDLRARCAQLPQGAWPVPPHQAVAVPIGPSGQGGRAGILIAGLNPFRLFDDRYQGFIDLVASQITASIGSANAYEEERRRAEDLAEIDRAKTAFFTNVSHEFRTPLTLMLGPLADLLSGGADELPPQQREVLGMVQRNGKRLLKLVNTLLDFSRIEAGRMRAEFEPHDLAAYTADLASVFRAAVESAGLRLIIDCPPLPEPVLVDRDLWEKVVLNLLSNAFKYTFEGEIAVSLRAENGAAVLAVRDTGTGIPAAELPNLFDRFHRVEGARGRTHEGTGIGLALLYELTKLHGGQVGVESTLGEGSTFTVRIPFGEAHLPPSQIVRDRARSTSLAAAGSMVAEAMSWLPVEGEGATGALDSDGLERRSAAPRGSQGKIVLADDNVDMRSYVGRLLSAEYEVIAVADGEEALRAAVAQQPDLILTDVMMPNLDGFGLVAALRADERTASIPIVMLSARAGEEARIEGLRSGVDDYLIKPFGARELMARVGAQIQMRRLRREADEALRQSEARYRLVAEAANDLIFDWDLLTDEMTSNEGIQKLFGYGPAYLEPNATWGETMLHPDERDRVIGGLRTAIEAGRDFWEDEYQFRRADGTYADVVARARIVRDDDGRAVRVVGSVTDQSDRRRAELALRESEARFHAVASNAPVAIFIKDLEGRYVLGNPVAAAALGRPRGVVGLTDGDLLPAETASALRGVDAEVIEAGRAVETEVTLGGRDFLSVKFPLIDAAGQVTGVGGVGVDITERKRAEELLRLNERLHRAIGDSIDYGVWICEPSGRNVYASESFLRLVGMTQQECSDFGWSAALHPDDAEETMAAWQHCVATGEPWDREHRFRGVDGEWHSILARGVPVRDESGEITGWAGINLDIGRLKQVENELREADQRKNEFLATLAHELRNPLAPVRNGLQIMRLARDNRAVLEEVQEMMERQVQQMVHLIDDLLDLSRVSRGKIELRKERVALALVLENAVDTSRPLMEQAGHELTISLPFTPVYVHADLTRLAQVFANLLNNAAKYTPANGHVRLSVERDESEVLVSVRDNGIGIAPTMLPRVFDMFTQIDQSLEKSQSGLGIGLSIVKRLVEMHGGRVWARSEGKGRGSEFVVRLPILAAVPAVEAGDGEGGLLVAPAPRRILVTDDNLDAAASLALLLEILGNEVRTAHDGLEAIEAARVFRPDVILLDIGMPKLNGYDACRLIRAEPWSQGMVIVALTGWGQDEDRRRSLEAGFDHHLVKPIERTAVERLLAGIVAPGG